MNKAKIRRFEPLDYHANEAFNTLCTNLFFTGADIKKIMVTSCHPQEGKSFVTMNLMRSLSGLGLRTILVDADIRASAIQGVYGVQIDMPEGQRYHGLTHYLAGQSSIDDIICKTDIPNAWMILSGKNVTNSLPLLNTPRLRTLLNALAGKFDVVLVDAPPVGTIIDAARIAGSCDGTMFVCQSGAISYREFQEAYKQIEKTGCPILGTVLNKFDEKLFGGRYYHKSSYYNRNDDEDTGREERRSKSPSGKSGKDASSARSGRAKR